MMLLTESVLTQRLAQIKLVIFDVDGVLTDGRLYYDNQGNEFKSFHVLDGHGMKQLQQAGIPIAIITARQSELVAKRMSDLGVRYVFQGARDKLAVFEQLLADFPSISFNVLFHYYMHCFLRCNSWHQWSFSFWKVSNL